MGYWDNICEIERKQTAKGIATYGQTLEENDSLTTLEKITMIEEELVDALKYLEHLKAEIEKMRQIEPS